MQKYSGPAPSVSARAAKLVDSIVADASALRCQVTTGDAGERCIDMGAQVPGGLEAGRRLAEVCMGGLGSVSLHMASGLKRWPLGVTVHAASPVIACLGSQYAGWQISEQESGFFALGSGPARALSRVEALYKDLGYVDHFNRASLVIEGDKAPPASVARTIAIACGVQPIDLTVLFAPTGSLAGTVQIAARVLEVALHKAHELHFPLEDIEDGIGTAPIAPPVPDFVKAMGRTNDAIIYGGRVQLFVRGRDEAAQKLAQSLPSSTCSAYGEPFADIFAAAGGDFYKIDPMLFSPAEVIVSNLDTGTSFHAGELAPDVVDKSFR
jgi:methenyltetrahydromethanopterin cyclohydrolase